jgi:hypothetical protein
LLGFFERLVLFLRVSCIGKWSDPAKLTSNETQGKPEILKIGDI